MRVILNEIIRDVLLKGFATKPPIFPFAIHTAQFQLATDTLYELQNDILSSVPQHLFTLPPPFHGQNPAQAAAQPSSSDAKGKQKQSPAEPTTAAIEHHVAFQLRLSQKKEPSPEPSLEIIDDHIEQQLRQVLALPNASPLPSRLPADGHFPFGRSYGGNFLLWPLWFAGIMDVATDEVRAFVVRNLRDIGDELGIKQGHVLADILEKGRDGPEFVL